MKTITVAITMLSILLLHVSVCRADEIPQPGSQYRQDEPGENTDTHPEIRPFQLSLVPFVGTEGTYAAENIYKVSLNIFGGFTGGVDGVELGGFLNINQFSMTGLQLSGFGNVVNGPVRGLQAAGFINVNNGLTQGLQGAGFGNVVNGNARSLQGSGFGNVITGNMKGIQVAGFGNVTAGRMEGIQAAGFGNVTGGMIAGIQVAGFGNIANEIEGIQMAGFLNVAKKVTGLQLGFINVADTVDGLPIGFLSIVRHGYRKLELTAGDAMNLSIGFKIGVRRFYNIFSLGTQFTGVDHVYAWGYGIGSEFNMPDNRFLNAEILSHRFMEEGWWDHQPMNMLHQARVTYARPLNERWQIFAGPSLNFHMVRNTENGNFIDGLAPYELFSFRVRDTNTRVWLGINAGIRFW